MSSWYYAKDSQQCGPVNESELKELLATGKLAAAVFVWRDGMADWAPADTLPELQFRPPPIPAVQSPFVPPTAVAAAAPSVMTTETSSAPEPAAEPAAAAKEPAVYDQADIETNKKMAALSYVLFLFLVPLQSAKDSPYARYHTNQGVILFIAGIIGWIGASAIIGFLFFLPFSHLVGTLVFSVVHLAWLVLAIIGVINAVKGRAKPLPFIGHFNIVGH
jgi:uncharacterized membrane protein